MNLYHFAFFTTDEIQPTICAVVQAGNALAGLQKSMNLCGFKQGKAPAYSVTYLGLA